MHIVPISSSALIVRLYNPLLAFILALFIALAIRSFILLFLDTHRGVFVTFFRVLTGVVFLILGWLYALFVTPLLDWDRPARATGAITAVGLLLWVLIRHRQRRPKTSVGFVAALVYFALFVILVSVATLTIIRTGYIALVGDRVTLLVNVTGETRSEIVSWTPANGSPRNEPLATHHVIIWLPSGETAADMWIMGDAFAVQGKAIRFSPKLHALNVPNLYALEFVHNGYLSAERQNTYPAVAIPFPGRGPLAVHPLWRPYQERLLNFWANHADKGSWWAVEIADNESAPYPLIDADGKPTDKTFLLVLRPEAIATSRGSSPLESNPNPRK